MWHRNWAERAGKPLTLKDSSNRHINLYGLIIYQRTTDKSSSPADSRSVAGQQISTVFAFV